MNTLTLFDEDDCSFVVSRRFSTVAVTVTRWACDSFPHITVATCTKSGKHLLFARTYSVLCDRSEDGTEEYLLLQRTNLRVAGIGRIKRYRAGYGLYGDWKSERNLFEALLAAGITDPDHCRGTGVPGEWGEMVPLNADGWRFMRGATCAEDAECVS